MLRILLFPCMAIVVACSGGSRVSTATGPTPVTPLGHASFALSGAGYESRLAYSTAGGGLVFCRREAGPASYLWVRLAESAVNNGERDAHLDLDLCNFTGAGTFSRPHDTGVGLSCGDGETLDLWWHDGNRVFVSRSDSAPCRVVVTPVAGGLEGTFECRGLSPFPGGGTPRLDVVSGVFSCAFTG